MTPTRILSALVLVALLASPALAGNAVNNPPGTGGGGGAVSSVSAAGGGCVTISPTTGAVIVDSSGCAGGGVTSAVAGTGIAVSSATGAVTFSLAPVSTQRIIGNILGSSAAPVPLSQAQVATFLGSSFLIPGNNLSDVGSASTSRLNLGLGTASTFASSAFAQTANNLSDLASAVTARSNLGLGTAAVQNVAAFLQPSNNLSDLGSASTARTNLGLGSIASNGNALREKAVTGSTSGAFSCVFAGALVGDLVVGAIDLTGTVDATTKFESVVTIAGHVQQTASMTGASVKIPVFLLTP